MPEVLPPEGPPLPATGTGSKAAPASEPRPPSAPEPPRTALAKPLRPAETGLAYRSALDAYIAEISRHPVLPPEQQIELAKRYHATGDVEAAYQLVTTNLRLVLKIAHEYRRTAFSLLDLVQEGNIGLMQAVKKFDPYRGVKFSSYAAWWIRAYIIRYLMDNWRMVKLGTTRVQRRLFFNLRKEKDKLVALGVDPAPKLLAERLEASEEDVVDMEKRLGPEEVPLDAPVSEDGRTSHLDQMAGTQAPADEALAQGQLRAMLRDKLDSFGKTLVDREKLLFERRLVADQPLTLQEIGDRWGITRERARQIEANLTRKLRAYLERELPEFKGITLGPETD